MILVGTDFSNGALIALLQGRALAHRLGMELEVVYVRRHLDGDWRPSDEERSWLRASRTVEFDVDVRSGTPWVELVRAAGDHAAQIIVIGTHGRTGFQPLALGSTAERLALLSPVPTLLVGGRERLPDQDVPEVGDRTSSPLHSDGEHTR